MQSFIDRFKAKASKAKQAQSRIKALERLQLISPAHIDSPFHFEFRAPLALPTSLLKLDQVATGYGETTILSAINFSLIPGERIGLLGLNGAGKSTFIKLLAGELLAGNGSMTRSKDLRIGYFAQHQVEQLDLSVNALLTMQRLDGSLSEREIRSYLGGFNFRGEKVLQIVSSFSGGEKARLVLALLIWNRPNLLLLDEPTNHLDLEMRLALNQALQGFDGSVILVSHDRHLLRSVCDDLWLVDSGQLQRFEQDVDAYPAWLAGRKARGSDSPGDSPNESIPALDQHALRKQLRTQQNQLNKIENEMSKLNRANETLQEKLADSSIYQSENREVLDKTLAEQAEFSRKLKQAEEEWMNLSEQIEASERLVG